MFQQNGEVVSQDTEVCEFLRGEIIGQSKLKNGTVIVVTRNSKEDTINIIGFDKSGQAKLLGIFESFEECIYKRMDDPYVNASLQFKNKIFVTEDDDIVIFGRVLRSPNSARKGTDTDDDDYFDANKDE